MSIAEQLEGLRRFDRQAVDLAERILSAQGGDVYSVDLVVFAALQRSLSVTDGFISLVEAGNCRLAAALVRMQLDSAMRLNALRLVDRPDSVVLQLLEGEPLNRLKSRDGKPLTDAYLHERLSEEYGWASHAYKISCGFVHFSKAHMQAACSFSGADREMTIRIGNRGREEWTEEQRADLIAGFKLATQYLIDLCKRMAERKEEGRLRPPPSP